MDRLKVNFGGWLEAGFGLYRHNFGTLVFASLLAILLSAATFGILAGPMLAGMLLITLGLLDEKDPKPGVGCLFKGFNYFLNAFLFVLIWGVLIFVAVFVVSHVPFFGQLGSLFIFHAAQALLLFAPFLIVDRQMAFWPASLESISRVRTNFWPFLGLSIVSSIIGSLGALACGIGAAVTAPIQVCILTAAYRDVFGDGKNPEGMGLPASLKSQTHDGP